MDQLEHTRHCGKWRKQRRSITTDMYSWKVGFEHNRVFSCLKSCDQSLVKKSKKNTFLLSLNSFSNQDYIFIHRNCVQRKINDVKRYLYKDLKKTDSQWNCHRRFHEQIVQIAIFPSPMKVFCSIFPSSLDKFLIMKRIKMIPSSSNVEKKVEKCRKIQWTCIKLFL